MFDIGFFELLVIGVIALLVLGPERLPHAVRMTGAWIGKFRRAATSVREEIEREVDAYEMQQRIKEQMAKSGLDDTREMLEKTKETLRNGILDEKTLKEVEDKGLGDYAKSLIEPQDEASGSSAIDHTDSREKKPPAPASKETTAAQLTQKVAQDQTTPSSGNNS